jgi:hypothetical protein
MKKLLIIAALIANSSAMALDWTETPQGARLDGQGTLVVNCGGVWVAQALPVDIPRQVIDTCEGYTIADGRLETAWYR